MEDEMNAPPTTTVEEDLQTAGRRKITLIWEKTQRTIAYIVIATTVLSNFITVITGSYALLVGIVPSALMVAIGTGALMQLNTMSGLVLGFYFGGSKTNDHRPVPSRGPSRSTDTIIIGDLK